MKFYLCTIISLVSCYLLTVLADVPVARNLVYHVAPGDEVIVTLKGWNYDGQALKATITSLPQNGEIYQLSQVFSDYGYEPKRAEKAIVTTPTVVTGSKNRIVFFRSAYGGPPLHSKYAEFTYTLTNGVDVSNIARIVITTDDRLMSSTFESGLESWTIIDNGNGEPAHQPLSRGSLSYYIYGIDSLIHRKETGDDSSLWYFKAPAKFLGNHWAAYGGSLNFILSSAEGSFELANLNRYGLGHLVILECATCKMNAGVRLVMQLSKTFSFDGSTTQFVLPLNENAGWIVDPKNVIIDAWPIPTQCEFVEVLTKLSGVKILGDFTRGYESVALDTVTFKHGPGQPMACYY